MHVSLDLVNKVLKSISHIKCKKNLRCTESYLAILTLFEKYLQIFSCISWIVLNLDNENEAGQSSHELSFDILSLQLRQVRIA